MYKEVIFWYMKKIISTETTPLAFSYITLIPIWKKKGSALDLNMMRYVHIKIWEAKLCDSDRTHERKDCGGIPQHTNRGNARIIQCGALSNTEDVDVNERGKEMQWDLPNFRHGKVL